MVRVTSGSIFDDDLSKRQCVLCYDYKGGRLYINLQAGFTFSQRGARCTYIGPMLIVRDDSLMINIITMNIIKELEMCGSFGIGAEFNSASGAMDILYNGSYKILYLRDNLEPLIEKDFDKLISREELVEHYKYVEKVLTGGVSYV
jgi:hypothetical protein